VTTFNHCRTCNHVGNAGDFPITIEADPFATGDSPAEVLASCPECRSDDVEWDAIVCECGEALPVEGYDDCAACILLDQYSHNSDYDAEAIADARKALPEEALCMIDEQIARTIDRGRA
jgi:hypothetical protein